MRWFNSALVGPFHYTDFCPQGQSQGFTLLSISDFPFLHIHIFTVTDNPEPFWLSSSFENYHLLIRRNPRGALWKCLKFDSTFKGFAYTHDGLFVKIITVTFVMFFTDINHALRLRLRLQFPPAKSFRSEWWAQLERCSPQPRSSSTTKPDQFIVDLWVCNEILM